MLNLNFKAKGMGTIFALASAVLAIAAAIASIVYGATYEQYADYMVVLTLVLGAALMIVYAAIDNCITEWTNLLGTISTSFGMGLFLVNSLNVWEDVNGNLQQYGSLTGDFNFFNSQGGPYPAIAIIVICLVAAICGVISCFKAKKEA